MSMARAVWNNAVIAQSDVTVIVEGNHYFPMESVNAELLEESSKTTVCSWKGTANYFTLVVDGKKNADAAWCYREPKDSAKEIANHVAFWRGVSVEA